MNGKCAGTQPILLPDALYLIEKSQLMFGNNAIYNSIIIQQQDVPILKFQNGKFFIYRILGLNSRQQHFDIINLSQQKC